MLKSIKYKSFIILFLIGVIITTPLVDAAYLAYTSTNTTNNFNHASTGQTPGVDSDHHYNRDAQLNFELPKDMDFTEKDNSGTFPNYNMHVDSVNWGSYLSPNTSIFESYDNSSVRTVESYYKERWDYQQILAITDTSITTMNFTAVNNGTIEFDFLFSDTTEFKIALCQNDTEIVYMRLLSGSWRFYTILTGASGANPGFSVDTWTYGELRWNRLGDVYITCRGAQETPLPMGNYSINNIKFEIEDNADYMLLNGMNSSIPKLQIEFDNSNPLIQHVFNTVDSQDNTLQMFDEDANSFCETNMIFDKTYSEGIVKFRYFINDTKTVRLMLWNGNDANRIHIVYSLTGDIKAYDGNISSSIALESFSVDTWIDFEIHFYFNETLTYTVLINDINLYGPFRAQGFLKSVDRFSTQTRTDLFNYYGGLYVDTEWFYSNETTMNYKKDFKVDTVKDYVFTDGWFNSRGLTVNSTNHVNLTYDSVESWDYDEFHFETVVKIEDNSIMRWTMYNDSGASVIVVEYHEESNRLSLFARGMNLYITTDEIDTDYPIWLSYEMIQKYTIVNGTYYDITLEFYSLFDYAGGFISTHGHIPTNFIGNYMFGLEFMSFGYTTAIIYAIDSDIILEYFPFSFASGFKDTGYIDQSILSIYKLHTDCYPTFDFTRYKVQSSFGVSYSNGYVFDILDGSQTYKRREVKARVIKTSIIDTLAIESYQLQNNVSFDENSFSFTTVFNLSLNYTVEIDMGAAKIYLNASEGIERDGFNVWFNGTTPITLSNPNYALPIVYLTIHKTPTHDNGLYYSVVLGSQYLSQSINITSDVSRPIVNFYNFDVDNMEYYSNGAMEIYGMKLTTYDSDFEQYRPKLPTTMAANLEFYGGKWFNPTGLLFRNVFSDSVIISFPNPILSYPLSSNYTIDYSYIAELGYISTITVGNVEEYEQTFIESRQGSNKSVYDTNSTVSDLFEYYQFSNFYINYSYLMVYIHPGNITINMEVYHEALWLMYIVDTQLALLDLALGMIVPFILMLIFPYAFYNVFGRNGAVIGFLIGFIVFGIGALISIPAAIIMSLISVFLAIIVYKQYGGKMNYYD